MKKTCPIRVSESLGPPGVRADDGAAVAAGTASLRTSPRTSLAASRRSRPAHDARRRRLNPPGWAGARANKTEREKPTYLPERVSRVSRGKVEGSLLTRRRGAYRVTDIFPPLSDARASIRLRRGINPQETMQKFFFFQQIKTKGNENDEVDIQKSRKRS